MAPQIVENSSAGAVVTALRADCEIARGCAGVLPLHSKNNFC